MPELSRPCVTLSSAIALHAEHAAPSSVWHWSALIAKLPHAAPASADQADVLMARISVDFHVYVARHGLFPTTWPLTTLRWSAWADRLKLNARSVKEADPARRIDAAVEGALNICIFPEWESTGKLSFPSVYRHHFTSYTSHRTQPSLC